jgi:hypothetical protein
MDGPRHLRTNRSVALGFEIFFVRREFTAGTREFATAATDFRASVTGFRARSMSSFAQSAWLGGLILCQNAKLSLVF